MSDFLYCRKSQAKDFLTANLKSIYGDLNRDYKEFHGTWGSLGLVENHYAGYQSYINPNHIAIVIGGPILKFNKSISGIGNSKTKAVYEYWLSGKSNWLSDFSGLFSLFVLDKNNSDVFLVTDMGGSIPVYYSNTYNGLVISSHTDAAAKVYPSAFKLDKVSIADFIVHKTVCFPYTFYENLFQCDPASAYNFSNKIKKEYYYLPYEESAFCNIKDAAVALEENLTGEINSICSGIDEIDIFLSGGEDSRVIASSIPENIQKKGWIYVDKPNKELSIANRVAKKLGVKLQVGYRELDHYLRNLEGASTLVGSQNEYTHVHTFGFIKPHSIKASQIIMGGLSSDSYFKGSHIATGKQYRYKGSYVYQKITDIKNAKDFAEGYNTQIVNKDLLIEARKRRKKNQEFIKKLRPNSYGEWSDLWPATMNESTVNFMGNRRLFSSYEPFSHNNLIELSAKIPQEWKINRKLFNTAFKKSLKKTIFISHTEGHFPYFSFKSNNILKRVELHKRKIFEDPTINQGSWPDYTKVAKTEMMQELILENKHKFFPISNFFNCSYEELFSDKVHPKQQILLLQLYNKLGVNTEVKYQ